MCRTCAGFHVFRGRRYQNNDIFLKLRVGLTFAAVCSTSSGNGPFGGTVGSRPTPAGWLAGWLQQRAGRYSDVAGMSVSLSD